MEWQAETLVGLEKEYQQRVEELQRDYELRKVLFIAANAKTPTEEDFPYGMDPPDDEDEEGEGGEKESEGYEPLGKMPLSLLVEMSLKNRKEIFDDEGEDEDYVTSPDISSDEEDNEPPKQEGESKKGKKIIEGEESEQEDNEEKERKEREEQAIRERYTDNWKYDGEGIHSYEEDKGENEKEKTEPIDYAAKQDFFYTLNGTAEALPDSYQTFEFAVAQRKKEQEQKEKEREKEKAYHHHLASLNEADLTLKFYTQPVMYGSPEVTATQDITVAIPKPSEAPKPPVTGITWDKYFWNSHFQSTLETITDCEQKIKQCKKLYRLKASKEGEKEMEETKGKEKENENEEDKGKEIDKEEKEMDKEHGGLRDSEMKRNIEREEVKKQLMQELSILSIHGNDFLSACITYGTIIITEKYLPVEKKTIKPTTHLGGVAGGVKYLKHGILFKFAVDDKGLFGGDHAAAKVASHELRGLMSFLECQKSKRGKHVGIHVPLMALIDYRGFRLVAMSLLPISGADSIVYGSSDGGRRMYKKNETFNNTISEIAQQLYLKPHMASNGVDLIYTPTDLEGHLGNDGRLYALDFSRLLPPETLNISVRNSHLYRLLRPEFLQIYGKPLSADAFSHMGHHNRDEHNLEVVEATKFLTEVVLPRLAAELCDKLESNPTLASTVSLEEVLHQAGVNMRYLGRLRMLSISHCQERGYTANPLPDMFLVEMIARVIRKVLDAKMRETMSKAQLPLEGVYHLQTISYFNLVFGSNPTSEVYWRDVLSTTIESQFEGGLDHERKTNEISSLKQKVNLQNLFKSLLQLTQFKWSTPLLQEVAMNPEGLFSRMTPFIRTDLLAMPPRTKAMSIVTIAEAYVLSEKAKRTSGSEAIWLLQQASAKYEEALRRTPGSAQLLESYANCLLVLGTKTKTQLLDMACTHLQSCFGVCAKQARPRILYKWALALQEISKRKLGTARVQVIKQAIAKYSEAIAMPGLNPKRKADAEEQLIELKRLLGTLIGDSLTSLGSISFDYSTGVLHAVVQTVIDGKKLVFAGSHTGRVVCCDPETCTTIWSTGHQQPLTGLLLDEKRGHVLTCSVDSTIKIWDLRTGAPIDSLNKSKFPVSCFCKVSDDCVLSVQGKIATIWDLNTRTPVRDLTGHTKFINAVVTDIDKDLVVTNAECVRLWRLSTGECRHVVRLPWSVQLLTLINFDRQRLLIGGQMAELWDVESGTKVLDFPGCTDITSATFYPPQEKLIMGQREATVTIWKISEDKAWKLHTIKHDSIGSSIRCTTVWKGYLATASQHSMQMWELESQGNIWLHKGTFEYVHFLEGGLLISSQRIKDKTYALKFWKFAQEI